MKRGVSRVERRSLTDRASWDEPPVRKTPAVFDVDGTLFRRGLLQPDLFRFDVLEPAIQKPLPRSIVLYTMHLLRIFRAFVTHSGRKRF